jgi:acyl-CoA thioesterase FadM
MKESLEFKNPVHIGDTVSVEGVIAQISSATHIIELDIQICVGDAVFATGQVHVVVRDT